MASPQKENGYTQLANELLEQLCYAGINGSEYRIIFVVIRKTYGFHKKSDRISLSQFEQFTGMKRAQAVDTIKDLLEKKILIVVDGKFSFNKNYEQWGVGKRLPRGGVGNSLPEGVGNSLLKGVGNSLPTKESIKESIKDTSKATALRGKEWNQLIDSFEAVNPMYAEFYTNKTERAALEAMNKAWGFERLLNTIKALPSIVTLPYAPKITKPTELKRDAGKLMLFYKQEESKGLKATNVYKV